MALHAKMFAARIGRVRERRFRIAAHGRNRVRQIGADGLEQDHVFLARLIAIGHRRHRLDIDRNGLQRILGQSRRVGDDDGQRLAHITHLAVGNDRLFEAPDFRRRIVTQRNGRHLADIGGRNDRMNAGPRQRDRGIDRADAAVRDRASQDRGMQHAFAVQIVDVLPTSREEAQILQPLDRAADEQIAGALSSRAHMTMLVFRFSRARATLSAASADVLGLVRDGLPCS